MLVECIVRVRSRECRRARVVCFDGLLLAGLDCRVEHQNVVCAGRVIDAYGSRNRVTPCAEKEPRVYSTHTKYYVQAPEQTASSSCVVPVDVVCVCKVQTLSGLSASRCVCSKLKLFVIILMDL